MKRIIVLLTYLLIFSSCENKEQKTRTDQNTIVAVQEQAVRRDWVEDFIDFRKALYENDTAKLKTYFDFPLYDDAASIWNVCPLTEAERNSRDKEVDDDEAFYEKDFDRYYKRIFDNKFLSGILELESAALLNTGMTQTEEFPGASAPYVMYASIDEGLKTLELNMAFRNIGTDGDGKPIEGESNVVYVFDVIDGKKLKFKKIVIAG